jgi:phosphotransferase system HPr (HPr) family protein
MSGETLKRKVLISNPQGFHMRPLTAFVELARKFQSTVSVWKADQRSDGKSPLELMTLGADCGTELILEVSGSDAQAALEALARVLSAPSPEELSEPPLSSMG